VRSNLEYLSIIAIALAVASMLIAIYITLSLKKSVGVLLDELAVALLIRKKSRRVKRYILLKTVCSEDADVKTFIRNFEQRISKLLGDIGRIECSLTIASISKTSNRMIVRVLGDYRCFKRVLMALSIQHILFGDCIAIPVRTSGLFSRLRKWIY
jgi:RNase P/RNase MRP subunit POP5